MPPYFDGLQRAQFGGIFFPVADLSVSSTQRHHIHEYPHTPGGALEKLGRKPYTFRVTPLFDESIRSYERDNGIPLYPDALERLQFLYEEETSAALTIPTLGSIQAFMTSFSRRLDSGLRSGERVELEFVEDQSSVFLLEQTTRPGKPSLADMADWVERERADATEEDTDLLDEIVALANEAFALVDSAERALNKVAAKLDALSQLLQRATSKINMLQHPENWRLLESLKELHASAVSLKDQLTGQAYGPRRFTVPKVMTVQQISMHIYNATDRGFDILRMNDIEDSLRVPAGTSIRYLP